MNNKNWSRTTNGCLILKDPVLKTTNKPDSSEAWLINKIQLVSKGNFQILAQRPQVPINLLNMKNIKWC